MSGKPQFSKATKRPYYGLEIVNVILETDDDLPDISEEEFSESEIEIETENEVLLPSEDTVNVRLYCTFIPAFFIVDSSVKLHAGQEQYRNVRLKINRNEVIDL